MAPTRGLEGARDPASARVERDVLRLVGMASTERTVDPMLLAELLDRWALRREKVLFVLDHKSARRARELSREAVALAIRQAEARTAEELDAWSAAWLRLRREAGALLVSTAAKTPRQADAHERRRTLEGPVGVPSREATSEPEAPAPPVSGAPPAADAPPSTRGRTRAA